MNKSLLKALLLFCCILTLSGCRKEEQCQSIHIVHTTDVHGLLFPYDLVNDQPSEGSYARVATYVQELKESNQEVLLLDAGDILQGQPTAYYYNYIDTVGVHPMGTFFNQYGYDAITMGNHDIETGHSVYDRFVAQLNIPALSANVLREESGEPYFQPFVIVNKGGRRIAVIGTTTPSLTDNLPAHLWSGMKFTDQVETVRKYVDEIKASKPDMIVALIHSGSGNRDGAYYPKAEHVGYQMAREVPELDLILLGHDHKELLDSVVHQNGKVTYLLNPGNDAKSVSDTEVFFCKQSNGGTSIKIAPKIVSLKEVEPDPSFMASFAKEREAVEDFISSPVGHLTEDIDARSSFFRPATFTDLIHQVEQFTFPQAEITLTAPLDFNVLLKKGSISIRDLFKLYRYENSLYLMRLTGEEVRGALEESYDCWIQTMSGPADGLIQINEEYFGGQYLATAYPTYNFDTASGITYTVDVRRPRGERVRITSVGVAPFDPQRTYLVAVNSYRGSGGGGLLTKGAGIPVQELQDRIVETTERDLRHYFMLFLQKYDPYTPTIKAKWSFEPREWTEPAIQRDSTTLFSHLKQ